MYNNSCSACGQVSEESESQLVQASGRFNLCTKFCEMPKRIFPKWGPLTSPRVAQRYHLLSLINGISLAAGCWFFLMITLSSTTTEIWWSVTRSALYRPKICQMFSIKMWWFLRIASSVQLKIRAIKLCTSCIFSEMTFRLIKIVHLRGRYRPGDAFVKINNKCPNVSSNINILSTYFRGDSFVKKHYVNEKSLMSLFPCSFS